MTKYIDKDALVAEIERLKECNRKICAGDFDFLKKTYPEHYYSTEIYNDILSFINTLEVKEVEELASTAYVVTRCEEHSDYVDGVFFDENKAQAYCDQFNGNENEYARHITKVEATL